MYQILSFVMYVAVYLELVEAVSGVLFLVVFFLYVLRV